MERKTKVHAEEGRQELTITREFDLPVDLLFRAYVEPEIVEYWMGTKVRRLENQRYGSYHFETTDPMGNAHHFSGTIHEFEPGKKITRTFEMENTPFPVQLEFLEFQSLPGDASRLIMHVIYKSVETRDQLLQMPFEYGINRAHDRLEEHMRSVK